MKAQPKLAHRQQQAHRSARAQAARMCGDWA
eukprot:CAMPEP_0195056050 /NCGR_PEP_ID=MMETSP0448-20130528/4603_1 /TAXON_ID=66468 /ORGANISM="Heterocapsa triquestra, Strain CCMP 448" /LENGTH=30 /DNA_ID= /DNA_START= /DNA_END= /DNA_ORIENTATION=